MPGTWGEGLALFLLAAGVLGILWHFAHVHLTVLRTGKVVERELTPDRNGHTSLIDKAALLLLAYSNLETQVEGNTGKLQHIDECLDRLRENVEERLDEVTQEQAAIWAHMARHGIGRREGDQ